MSIEVQHTILVVCTANICRSASGAHVLRETLTGLDEAVPLLLRSAGTHAKPDMPGCDLSMPLVGADPALHRATTLTPELVRGADLVLCAAKDHRGFIAQLAPAARSRTFTFRQAARISDFLVSEDVYGAAEAKAAGTPREFAPGDHRIQVAPLPDRIGRLRWWVAEMDAARGLAPAAPGAESEPSRRGRANPAAEILGDPDDVVDPHVVGYERHGMVVEQITEAMTAIARGLKLALQGR